jgi:formate dehydrogenase iron-sulfur subunit
MSETIRIFVPVDAAALSVGAEGVAQAIAKEAKARGIAIELIRNGSRGMVWLEPMVEVECATGRYAFGPVTAKDVPGLFEAGWQDHPLALGPTDDLPWMKAQTRLTFQRCGLIDPLSLSDYEAHGGLAGLRRALADPAGIVAEVTASGLRGRGGAGFPDRHQVEDRGRSAGRRRNTSSAMPTKVTAGPSPTGC